MSPRSPALPLALVLCAAACGTTPAPTDGTTPADGASDAAQDVATDTAPADPPQVQMDFTRAGGFYSAPFPGDERRTADGHVDLTGFPNARNVPLVVSMLAMLHGVATGFSTTSAVYFQLTGPLDGAHLPDAHASLADTSPVVLISVDPAAPDYLTRYPVTAHFDADAGPFGARNLLSLLPVQGVPLRPNTTYAAVLRPGLTDPQGRALRPAPVMAGIAAGTRPDALPAAAWARYQTALTALAAAHIDVATLAGMTVFTTGAPAQELGTARTQVLERTLPAPLSPWVMTETFPEYCVYQSTVRMPVYQTGTPPYTETGGGWTWDASGRLVLDHEEEARVVVTIPRRAMPTAGFPTGVFVRTGGGGERPLVDRGVHAVPHGDAVEPGTGPALYFARAGFAGASVDGPHGGLRNITHGDEQVLMFNFSNPPAMRDNVRQSALEIMLFAHMLRGFDVDASSCPGVTGGANGHVMFDTGTLALMGHSMGATIAPLVLAHEPLFRAAVLSGAGGSYIENVMYKLSPFEVRPFAELIVRYNGSGRHLTEFDPVLSMLQWSAEPSDPPVYDRYILHEPLAGAPRSVLMFQGIVDTYIMPPIADATSLSLGVDLADPERDLSDPRIAMFPPVGTLIDLVGRREVMLPQQGNVSAPSGGGPMATGVVVQHTQDMIEDGHEVVFQTEAPKHQYQCFLASFARGVPRVPPAGAVSDPCE